MDGLFCSLSLFMSPKCSGCKFRSITIFVLKPGTNPCWQRLHVQSDAKQHYLHDHWSASCPNSQQLHSRRPVHKNFSSCSCICRCCGLGQAALQIRCPTAPRSISQTRSHAPGGFHPRMVGRNGFALAGEFFLQAHFYLCAAKVFPRAVFGRFTSTMHLRLASQVTNLPPDLVSDRRMSSHMAWMS